jgi:hypothetical protein
MVDYDDSLHGRSEPLDDRTIDRENYTMPATQSLPPPRAIFAADTEKFTRNPSARQPELRDAIPKLIGSAFVKCELSGLWEARALSQGTGDGYVFALPQERTPFLLHPLLDQLQEVLEEHDRALRSQDRSLRLRLRVAVHMGSVPDSDGHREGVGTPMNEAFRLLDSDPVKHELSRSNRDITLLAAIVSQRVFEEVVRAGFTPGLPPGRFRPVIAEVAGKEFVQPAWMYVPKPSHPSDRMTRPSVGPSSGSAEPPAQTPGGTTIRGNVGRAITGGNFSGNVTMGDPGS